ncbi:MAG: hypothetical protein JWO90_1712 [Solirubrobacterales bacterium]|nr:hypothetical protein [Solirubrobacterales bacterium]
MSSRRTTLPAFVASLVAALALVGSLRFGVLAIVAPLALVAGLALLARPEWALGVAVALPILVEPEPDWGPSTVPSRLYELIPGTKLDPLELLVLLAVAAALLHRRATGTSGGTLGPIGPPLVLLGLALVAGTVTGYDAGAGPTTIVNAGRHAIPLLVLPFVVVQVVGLRVALRTALGALLALAAFKGLAGLGALATGLTAGSVGGQALTYYNAPANALCMFGALFVVAATVRRLPLPLWMYGAGPVMVASLVLSYRRSFWVATALALVLVGLFAIGRQSRRLGLPALAATAVALFLTLGSGVGSGLTPAAGPGATGLGGRLASLDPTAISQSKDDRYRIGERRNVLAGLREAPVSGLGLGVEYRARYPLSIGSIPRDYVHFASLWWWMKTGILGLVGYVWLVLAAMWAAARIVRSHPDPRVRAAGLAAGAGLVGYAVAETTATFTGPDARSGVLLGTVLGLLAVAHREAVEDERAPLPA